METFQKFILFAAIILLVITLVMIGMALKYSDAQQWPPVLASCPDYWSMDGSGNKAICINDKDLGICPPKPGEKHLKMDFNNPQFTGSNEVCAKYTWAKNCGVTWDGITYGVENPCK